MEIRHIRDYLECNRKYSKGCHNKIGEYFGLEDFILKNGYRFLTRIILPPNTKKGDQGSCYKNTFFNVALNADQYYYCEGYAGVKGKFVLHAWIANKNLQVIDPTWVFGNKYEYYGIIFKLPFVSGNIHRGFQIACLIDNWQDGWPLLMMPRKEFLKNIIIPKIKE